MREAVEKEWQRKYRKWINYVSFSKYKPSELWALLEHAVDVVYLEDYEDDDGENNFQVDVDEVRSIIPSKKQFFNFDIWDDEAEVESVSPLVEHAQMLEIEDWI